MVEHRRHIQRSNVCVVGGAGFLGSHLVDHLIEDRSCNVLVLDNLVTGRREFIHKEAEFVHCDITGSEHVIKKLLKAHQIEYLFNFAASPYIPVSFERPLYVFDINAFGALKVLNAAQEAGVEAMLQVSSAEIYGDIGGKIKESDATIPHSTYGVSKLAIDHLVQVRYREAKTPVISMRQFNCYAPRETHPYIIPEIISQIDRKGPHLSLGNNSTRDFLYAGDAVRMATELLEYGEFGEVYNSGSEDCIKIYDLAQVIGKLMGHECVHITVDPKRVRPWEIWHLQSDNTKLYEVIDYRPTTSLREGLMNTISYFQRNCCKWPWQR